MECPFFNIDDKILTAAQRAEEKIKPAFDRISEIENYNQLKVLKAFGDNQVSESHFAGSTGYGYGDRGRETLDAVYAQVFGCEDALVRHNFTCGTHALTAMLFGVLRPGDVMLCVTGTPYDTLQSVIGLTQSETNMGTLKDFGIIYRQVDLLPDSTPDYDAIHREVKDAKVDYIQRSRGYALRDSLTVSTIESIIRCAKEAKPEILALVDNCYGEFVEKLEPSQVGADLMAGSLIKNPGGGCALTGGYIAGKAELVESCAYRLTAPGVGKEVGCTLGELRSMYMGFFHAPCVTASALKTASFAAALFEEFGYRAKPGSLDQRTDIIEAIELKTPERLIAFCKGVQRGAPVDAFVTPEPSDMPGYDSQVIMAAGAFTLGASIEFSADAPLREPYAVWMQGGLTYPSARAGVLLAAQSMLEEGLL